MQLYNADCFTTFGGINDQTVDCIITDPPYGINYDNHGWDKSIDFMKDFISESYRMLKPSGSLIMFTGWSSLAKVLQQTHPFILQNIICYDRIKGRGAKRNFVSTREEILFMTKSKDYTFHVLQSSIKKKTGGTIGNKNGKEFRTLSNVWTDISPIVPWSKERVAHPTQKPLMLMERIVNVFSNEGDLILDPFMGSGTTGVACQKLNRDFIGIEKEDEYFELAQDRLQTTE